MLKRLALVSLLAGACSLDRHGGQLFGSDDNGTSSNASSGVGGATTSSSSGLGGDPASTSSGTGGATSGSSGGMGGATSSSSASSSSSGTGGALNLGDPCSNANQCASTYCQDGVCCDAPCANPCEFCAGDGMCQRHEVGYDDCAVNGELCDKDGLCACGVAPKPSNSSCPTTTCTGGCSVGNETCFINCSGNDGCVDSTINCPAGYHCKVNCDGNAACSGNTTINCPADYACSVSCIANSACKGSNVVINCGADGPCSLLCDATDACIDAEFNCGANACASTCLSGGPLKAMNNPNSSCGFSEGNDC